jgi:hypothetical protein
MLGLTLEESIFCAVVASRFDELHATWTEFALRGMPFTLPELRSTNISQIRLLAREHGFWLKSLAQSPRAT